MKFLTFIIVSLIISSCGNEQDESTQKIIPQKINSSIYGNSDFEFPIISENTRAEVINWGAFEDFEKQAKTKNFLFSNSVDFIYEVFNFDKSKKNKIFIKILKAIRKNKNLTKNFIKLADR